MSKDEEFIGYTVGLECWVDDDLMRTKIEYTRIGDNVVLRAVNGRDLSAIPGFEVTVSAAEFERRPIDPLDSIPQAIWALETLGIRPSALLY